MSSIPHQWTEIKIGRTVVKSFGYDAAGRRTSATYSGLTTSYAYDYESRITSITRTGVRANSFAYNGSDTRVSKTDSGGTATYKRAGAYVTDSLLKSTVSSTTTDYTPGVSSRVSGTSTFDHAGLKNTGEQTDSSGDIAASRQYDAFGNVVSSYQTWTGPFGYGGAYGYQRDADHGLMLLGHRYYDSDTGRFLTRDPIKDGRNWYGYCGGNPVSWADPLGLQSVRQYIQMGLDVIGIFDPFGVVDTANAITHAVNGEWGDAGLTIIGVIPIVGDVAKVGKWLRIVDKAEEVSRLSEPATKVGVVYVLRDLDDTVRYVGSTVDYNARRVAHARDPGKMNLRFDGWVEVVDPLERLIGEQELINHFGGPNGGQLMNKINAISKKSTLFDLLK